MQLPKATEISGPMTLRSQNLTPWPNLSSAAPPTDAWLPKGSRVLLKHPPGHGRAAAAWLPIPAPAGIDMDAPITERGQ